MAEQRQKTHHILLSTDGKNITLELFDARLWPDKSSADNEFRVRIDGKWYSPAGKYTFLPYAAVGGLVSRLLSGREIFEDDPAPALRVKQRVRVHFGDCIDGIPMRCTGGFIAAPPYRGVDGRWYVAVSVFGGTETFLCHDVEAAGR
ncbi:hypothetical protein LJC59_00155 [Desulfovibrio sp. OttesenSCG-928-A18]|nr:hypothetical protein [Desulfovibrio sp. OttesenSCG-928-A18]